MSRMPARYGHLNKLIEKHKPQHICEIGTNKGGSAISMCNTALRHNDNIKYTGYDLFEEGSALTNAEEYNLKGSQSYRKVLKTLKDQLPTVEIELIMGDTKKTIPDDSKFDFVFIDGGHSIETIANDFAKVKESTVIVFDDFYYPDDAGNCLDVQKIGCNKIVDEMQSGWDVEILDTMSLYGKKDVTNIVCKGKLKKFGFVTFAVFERGFYHKLSNKS